MIWVFISLILCIGQIGIAYLMGKKYNCFSQDAKKKNVFLIIFALICSYGFNALLITNGNQDVYGIINLEIVYFVLLAASVVDLYVHKIPNSLLLVGMAARIIILILLCVRDWEYASRYIADSFFGVIIWLLLMLFISMISKQGVGYGDVKIFAYLGFTIGILETYYVLFYSSLLAALCSAYILLRKIGDRKKKIPFGPFICGGFLLVYFFSYIG